MRSQRNNFPQPEVILEFLQLIETANSADRYAAKQINAFSFSFSFAAYPDEYVCVLWKKLPFSQQMIIRFFSRLGCVKTWFRSRGKLFSETGCLFEYASEVTRKACLCCALLD